MGLTLDGKIFGKMLPKQIHVYIDKGVKHVLQLFLVVTVYSGVFRLRNIWGSTCIVLLCSLHYFRTSLLLSKQLLCISFWILIT